jgi:hypothetical protein
VPARVGAVPMPAPPGGVRCDRGRVQPLPLP